MRTSGVPDQKALRSTADLVDRRKLRLEVLRITSEAGFNGKALAIRVMFNDLRHRLVKGPTRKAARWKVHRNRDDPRKRLILDTETKQALDAIHRSLKIMRHERVTGGVAGIGKILAENQKPYRAAPKVKRGKPRLFAVTGLDASGSTLAGFIDLGNGHTRAFTYDGALVCKGGETFDLTAIERSLAPMLDKAIADSLF